MKKLILALAMCAASICLSGSLQAGELCPNDRWPDEYRDRGVRTRDSSNLYFSFSFGEGVYFHYNCGSYGCDAATVAPADFEFLLGYRLARHWQLDLSALWALDFDHYGNRLTSMVGFRPGVRLLLPGLYGRMWYLRAAVPVVFGVSGENDDILVGFLLGVGLEFRFNVVGIFGEVDFAPYFVEAGPGYYVVPVQGRIGLSFRF